MSEWIKDLTDRLGKRAEPDAPLAPLTTFAIGGPAQLLVHVESILELLWIKDLCRQYEVPLRILGGGSNVLVPDQGLPGLTVLLEGELAELHLDTSSGKVKAGAGLSMSRLAAKCADAGLSGLEWASGLPGSVGGAVVGNAGAFAGRVSDSLVSVRLLERSGRVSETPAQKLGFDYRASSIPASGAFVLVATFTLAPGDPELIRSRCDEVRRKRRDSQPLGQRSAGSVFKNPPNDAAGRLLDAASCKGLRVGDALVSPTHANFIVNAGHASAADVKSLIAQMQSRVRAQFNVSLTPEIIIL